MLLEISAENPQKNEKSLLDQLILKAFGNKRNSNVWIFGFIWILNSFCLSPPL